MVALNVVQRFRQQNDLRAYRRKIADEIRQSLALSLLPALANLSLAFRGADGALHNLEDALTSASRLTLAGGPGSGRRLALQQLALRWAATDTAPIPVMLPLPLLDDGRSSPSTLVGHWLVHSGQADGQKASHSVRSKTAASVSEDLSGWGLLIDGWEELPPERRTAWRDALADAPYSWPEAQIVISVPASEPQWPGFSQLAVTPPTPATVAQWIRQLVPAAHQEAVLEALKPGGALEALSERLAEIAMLAWVAPRSGLPANRACLYAQALTDLIALTATANAPDRVLNELQLLAAYDEQPGTIIPGLLQPKPTGGVRIAHPLVRDYLAARQLVAEGRYDLLLMLGPAERAEVARFAATIAGNPNALFTVLWGTDRPAPDNLFTLGRCLRDRPNAGRAWTLRIVAALALLVRKGHAAQQAEAAALLPHLMPGLGAALDLITHAGAPALRIIPRLLDLLPADLARPHIERLVYNAGTAEAVAWELADRLVGRIATFTHLPPPPSDQPALARWAYIQALGGSENRAHLIKDGGEKALAALAASSAGDTRLLRVAAVLVDDQQIPPAIRVAGVAMLADNDQPTASTIIERACSDQAPEVCQAALTALQKRDPQRAQRLFSHTAFDYLAPLETRLDAIERLSTQTDENARILLARCVHDTSLPLYARLLSVSALGASGSAGHLEAILHDTDQPIEIRAAAARWLGTTHAASALPKMLAVLTDPSTPSALAIGLCEGLGALGDEQAVAPLVQLLDACAADLDLTLTVIRSLGRLGAEPAVPRLSNLLSDGASERLHRVVPASRLHESTETLLASAELPESIAQRLAIMRASSITAADRPTTLSEFLGAEADRLRVAAAEALASIGGNAARAALLAALLDGGTGGATSAIIDALAQIDDDDDGPEALGYLLVNPDVNPLIRWLIVQRLRDHPHGEALMHRTLAQPEVDTFTRGALAEALGQRGAVTALPLLCQLADDSHADNHLRSQAVIGLGLLDDPAAEVVLIRLIGAANENIALRGLAAEYLPSQLSPEGRRFLRELLRRERPPAPIIAGALRALGRARDREALPLMLRYCQDDPASVAQAALLALSSLGDASVAPVLIRVVQNPTIDHATRLHAVGTLLRLGGNGYRPLLKTYLESGPLPLRLQALEHLIDAAAPVAELVESLGNREWPLPLRLRLLERCAREPAALEALLAIVQNKDEDLQLRGRAADALSQHPAAAALATLANQPDTPIELRVRCIAALHDIGSPAACLALNNLATTGGQIPLIRQLSLQALSEAAGQRTNQPTTDQ